MGKKNNSKYNPKYVAKPFEYKTGAILYRNGTKLKTDTTTRIFESMLLADAFADLTSKQKILYIYCKAQWFGKKKPKDDEVLKDLGLFQDDDCFYFPLRTATAYGLYNKSTHSNFYKDMQALIDHGFIERVSAGRFKQKSIYRYSDRWKTWNE